MIQNTAIKNAQRVRVGNSEIICLPAADFDQLIHEYNKLYYEKSKPDKVITIATNSNSAARDSNSLLSVKEAAALLSVGKSTMWSYLKHENAPKPIKLGRSTRYRYSDLVEFIKSCQTFRSMPQLN